MSVAATIADGTTCAAIGASYAGRTVRVRAVLACGVGNAKGRAVAGGINATAAGTTAARHTEAPRNLGFAVLHRGRIAIVDLSPPGSELRTFRDFFASASVGAEKRASARGKNNWLLRTPFYGAAARLSFHAAKTRRDLV